MPSSLNLRHFTFVYFQTNSPATHTRAKAPPYTHLKFVHAAPLFTLPDQVSLIKWWWSTCPSAGLPVIHHPSHACASTPSPCLLLCALNTITHSMTNDRLPLPRYQKKKKQRARPLLNEGTLAAPCSPCLSAGEQCPWPSCVPLLLSPLALH